MDVSLSPYMDKVIHNLTDCCLECDVYQLFNQLQRSIFSIFIDTRNSDLYQTSHLIDSIHIPLFIPKSQKSQNETQEHANDHYQATIAAQFEDNTTMADCVVFICTSQMNNNPNPSNTLTFNNHLKSIVSALVGIGNFNPLAKNAKILVFKDSMLKFEQIYPFLCSKPNLNVNLKKQESQQIVEHVQESKSQMDGAFDEYPILTYPNAIEKDVLYLGDLNHARNKTVINNLGITHIVNCLNDDTKDIYFTQFENGHCCKVNVNSTAEEQIGWYLDYAISFIQTILSVNISQEECKSINDEIKQNDTNNNKNVQNTKHRILVFCRSGVSISPTIVIAYLMVVGKWTFDVALKYVQDRRLLIAPNHGFVLYLKRFYHKFVKGVNQNIQMESSVSEMCSEKLTILTPDSKNKKSDKKVEEYNMADVYNDVCDLRSNVNRWKCQLIDIRARKDYLQANIRYSLNIPIGIELSNKYVFVDENENENKTDTKEIVTSVMAELRDYFAHVAPKKIVFVTDSDNSVSIESKNNDSNNKNDKNTNNGNQADETDVFLKDVIKFINDHSLMNVQDCKVYNQRFEIFLNKFPFLGNVKDCKEPSNSKLGYPNIIIENKIFLGDYQQAKNARVLKDLGITHVLNCAVDAENTFENSAMGIKYLKINVYDTYQANIAKYFPQCIDFINNVLDSKSNCNDNKNNKVLVHCIAGRSRSVTIVAAYLMKMNKMSADQALAFIKSKRSQAHPNGSFIKQLKRYESETQINTL